MKNSACLIDKKNKYQGIPKQKLIDIFLKISGSIVILEFLNFLNKAYIIKLEKNFDKNQIFFILILIRWFIEKKLSLDGPSFSLYWK